MYRKMVVLAVLFMLTSVVVAAGDLGNVVGNLYTEQYTKRELAMEGRVGVVVKYGDRPLCFSSTHTPISWQGLHDPAVSYTFTICFANLPVQQVVLWNLSSQTKIEMERVGDWPIWTVELNSENLALGDNSLRFQAIGPMAYMKRGGAVGFLYELVTGKGGPRQAATDLLVTLYTSLPQKPIAGLSANAICAQEFTPYGWIPIQRVLRVQVQKGTETAPTVAPTSPPSETESKAMAQYIDRLDQVIAAIGSQPEPQATDDGVNALNVALAKLIETIEASNQRTEELVVEMQSRSEQTGCQEDAPAHPQTEGQAQATIETATPTIWFAARIRGQEYSGVGKDCIHVPRVLFGRDENALVVHFPRTRKISWTMATSGRLAYRGEKVTDDTSESFIFRRGVSPGRYLFTITTASGTAKKLVEVTN